MKKAKISPLDSGQNRKVLIDEDEYTDNSHIELLCPTCHTNSIITLSDGAGNSDKFCKRCSCVYNEEDDIIRHRQRLLPPLEPEPAASTTPTIGADDVAIRHPPEIKGGLKALQQRGLKITHYEEWVG